MSNDNSTKMLDPAADACRFLAQATFGADRNTIDALAGQNYGAWIDDQRNKPISRTRPYMDQILAEEFAVTDPQQSQFNFWLVSNMVRQAWSWNFSTAWMRNVVHGEDQLRQRIAWTLSQIFVISYQGDLVDAGNSIADFYDTLAENAFGNFRDLLTAVTMHPGMSHYLSSLGNQKADPSINRYPDENYAREVMQLFTIGLWELNNDGTHQLDSNGEPIPTYDNDDIAEMAKVFTGLWFIGKPFGEHRWSFHDNMRELSLTMFEEAHETGTKTLFHDKAWETVIAADQPGLNDIDQVLDLLFNHHNTPPFICKQLIQFLVKSQPSPAYVERISNVFIDNGSGVRGDLHAVVKAILLDTEARTYNPSDVTAGKLHEPMVRITRLVKAFRAGQNLPDLIFWYWPTEVMAIGQWPMASPSVFNFFEPEFIDYQSPLGQASPPINAPEFQIVNPISMPSLANMLHRMLFFRIHELWGFECAYYPDFVVDIDDLMPVAEDTDALIDAVDQLLTFGELLPQTRAIVREACEAITLWNDEAKRNRILTAIYLIAISPDGAILI